MCINLVDIDIEGYELSVLIDIDRFLNANFVDYIQLEYDGVNLDSHNNLM